MCIRDRLKPAVRKTLQFTGRIPNCPPESGGQRHRVLCDDARGGSPNEMLQNAFLKSAAREPPPARSRLLSRSCCPPDSGGQSGAVSYTHLRAHETPEHLVC